MYTEPEPLDLRSARAIKYRGSGSGPAETYPTLSSSAGLICGSALEMKELNNRPGGDMGSVDSSDTYASCNTHPFISEEELPSVVYASPLEQGGLIGPSSERPSTASAALGQLGSGKPPSPWGSPRRRAGGGHGQPPQPVLRPPVRSCSGDLIRAGEPVTVSPARARRARFQQVPTISTESPSSSCKTARPSPRGTGDSQRRAGGSHESLGRPPLPPSAAAGTSGTDEKKSRRPSFLPTKGIASATKLINQHLFGAGSGLSGNKGSTSEHSRVVSPSDRRSSKPILKKAESRFDPETERLLDAEPGGGVSASPLRGDSLRTRTPSKKPGSGSSSYSRDRDRDRGAHERNHGQDESSRRPKSAHTRDGMSELMVFDRGAQHGGRGGSTDVSGGLRGHRQTQGGGGTTSGSTLESSDSSTLSPGGSTSTVVTSRSRLPPPLTPTPSSTTSSTKQVPEDFLFADSSPNRTEGRGGAGGHGRGPSGGGHHDSIDSSKSNHSPPPSTTSS